jgi:molybdopterin-guanine dinucleotide biosynthesis protein A
MKITGIVLAGGESLRMGQEKAFIMFEGESLVERSISLLNHFCDSIIISSNNRNLENLGYEIVEDEHHRIGPIAGLFAALKASIHRRSIVIPCDTPFVPIDVYEKLLQSSKTYEAVVAGTEDNLIEPLIGVYHKSVVEILKKQIERGDYKLHNALKLAHAKVERFPDKALFTNINSPSDLWPLICPTWDASYVREEILEKTESLVYG